MEDLHRLIAEKCLLKYKQISKKKTPSSNSEWSPLAAIALVQRSCTGTPMGARDIRPGSIIIIMKSLQLCHLIVNCVDIINIEVVSLGTGSKCIGPKRMDKDGKCLTILHTLIRCDYLNKAGL